MSLAYSEEDFNDVIERFVKATHKMKNDGWWWQHPMLTNKSIKRLMLTDMLKSRFPVLQKFSRQPVPDIAFNDIQRGNSL